MPRLIQEFTQEEKKEIESKLVTQILSSLEQNKISLQDMKEIANFILDRIEVVKDKTQLIIFLEGLQNKWNVFKNIYLVYKNMMLEEKEKAVINKLSRFVSQRKSN